MIQNDHSRIPFFFILGRPRSGTTLLRTLFDAHPRVIVPMECPLIINLFPKYGKLRTWTREDLLSFHRDVTKQWKFDTWLMDPEKLRQALMNCEGKNTYLNILKTVYLEYPSFFKKTEIALLGDKNPKYSLYSVYPRRLLKIFPEAKFIHLTRDYRDIYLSYTRVDFEAPIPALVAYRWKHSLKMVYRLKEKHPGQFISLKYEDLAHDPENHLIKLCAFLDIPYDPEVLDFYKVKDDILKVVTQEVIDKVHSSLFKPISTKSIGVWKTKMQERQVRIADQVAGKYAEMAGYERKYKGFSLSCFLSALPFLTYGRLWYAINYVADHLPYRLRNAYLRKGPLMSMLYFALFRHGDARGKTPAK